MEFKTKLWKRSQKSFATTIPHVALLQLDESREHEVIWEYSKELDKWTISFKELPKKNKGKKNEK